MLCALASVIFYQQKVYKMKIKSIDFIKQLTLFILIIMQLSVSAQNRQQQHKKHRKYQNKHKSDANIIGHVTANGEHLPFATVLIEGTTIGTATDATGHFRFINLPEGEYVVRAQAVGYKSKKKEVVIIADNTIEVKFDLQEDLIGLEQVVVSANRNEQNRKDALTLVDIISPKLFTATQSVSLGDGLNFTPGLRVENDCQNCGFSQVRMNGMEGPYSQILINSRPIFSGLAAVYGLELFPASMVERVEVVRGGGSVLYGSNAIAGTINMITKDPVKNGFEVSGSSSAIGVGLLGTKPVFDNNLSFNTAVVDLEAKAGVTVYGFVRSRQPFDANGDNFSEIAKIKNTTVGTRAYHRTGKRGKITFDYFNIREERRGGDEFAKPVHESNISEAVEHIINTGAITFDQIFNSEDKLSVFASVQHVDRGSYYGAHKDPSAYGHTNDLSFATGVQLSLVKDNLLFAKGNMVAGIENTGGFLNDSKLGYYDYVTGKHVDNTLITNQMTNTTGVFMQGEWEWERFKASVGLRYDHFIVGDRVTNMGNIDGDVFSPRITIKYDITSDIMARVSYSHGFRAPQIFNEDLHIEVSGARKVIHKNDPNLSEEKSRSVMASLDIDMPLGYMQNEWLIEGFYTRLIDPFVNTYGEPDTAGTVIYTRTNSNDGAFVAGVNLEWNIAPKPGFVIQTGFTWQVSKYDAVQEFNENNFFRTPDTYGFVTMNYDIIKKMTLSVTGNYTGSMLVPYFGAGMPEGKLMTSHDFFDIGAKVSYNIKLNGTVLQLNCGIKNIFNSYQSDFDTGVDRDPGYIYGPALPRTVYFGLKFSNL